jgi:type IV pilus modification protein PilV
MDLMRFSSGRTKNSNESGFTLLEVLVGITILAVGMLAVAQMQITSIEGIDKSDESAIALNLAQREMERIIDMDYSDASLADTPSNNGDLYSTANTDYQDCVDYEGSSVMPGGECLDELNAYNLIYNIKNNTTGAVPTPYKEVVLIVQWKRKGKTFTRTFTFVKSLAS